MSGKQRRYLALLLTALALCCGPSKSQGIWSKYGCRVDLCFILDRSGSIGPDNWNVVKEFAKSFVDKLIVTEQSSQVGLVMFDTFGSLMFGLEDYNGDKPGLINKIDSLPCCGSGTSIDHGLYEARTACFSRGNRDDAPDVAVLMTDGQSSVYEANKEGQQLRQEGVTIVAIGVGNSINRDLLLAIADSEDNLFVVSDFAMLLADTSFILGKSCACEENCCGALVPNWQESDFPLLLDCPRLSNPVVDDDIFKFECSVNYSVPLTKETDARFFIQFLHDGMPNNDVSFVISPPQTKVELHEYYMMGHLGQYLRCQVQSYWASSPDSRSPFVSSRSYWAGITFSEETVTIYETDTDSNVEQENVASVFAYSTLPILCPAESESDCSLPLQIETEGSVAVYQRVDDSHIRRCYYKFFESDWKANESLAYNVQNPLQVALMRKLVPVKIRYASITMSLQPQNNKLKIALHGAEDVPAGTEYSPWSDYQVKPLQLQVFSGTKKGICSATGDPHIRTFDGSRIDVYEMGSTGIYVLFDSKKYRLQVQILVQERYITQVSVNDGGQITFVTFKSFVICEADRVRSNVTTDGRNTFYVRTFSGAVIKIVNRSRYFEVFIEVPPQFWNQTAGLCASLDGNPSNDIQTPDGIDFKSLYRLPPGSSGFFECPSDPYVFYEFCQCTGQLEYEDGDPTSNTDVCGLDDALLQRLIPHYPVTLLLPRFVLQYDNPSDRAKRQIHDTLYLDDVIDYEPPVVTEMYDPNPAIPDWGTHQVTEQTARQQCTKTITESSIYALCQPLVKQQDVDTIIASCVEDIQITGDLSFALNTIHVYRDICQVNMINEAADYVSDPENPLSDVTFQATFKQLLDASCPANCSGHGVCNETICRCHPDYTGVDCSLLKGTPPSNVSYAEDDFCDLVDRPCRSVRLHADNVMLPNDVWCRIAIKLHDDSESVTINKGTIQAPGTISCRLTDNVPTFFMYKVALSNDGQTFVQSSSPFIYMNVGDSTEMLPECKQQGKYRSDQVTRVIEGRCYVTEPDKSQELKGLITTFGGLNINQFATFEVDIQEIIVNLLNNYTNTHPAALCTALDLSPNVKEDQAPQHVFDVMDIRIADGYPQGQEESEVKWLAAIYLSKVKDVCITSEEEEQLDRRDVSSEYLKKALVGLDKEVSQLLAKDVQVDYEVPMPTAPPSRTVQSKADILTALSVVVTVCASLLTLFTQRQLFVM